MLGSAPYRRGFAACANAGASAIVGLGAKRDGRGASSERLGGLEQISTRRAGDLGGISDSSWQGIPPSLVTERSVTDEDWAMRADGDRSWRLS